MRGSRKFCQRGSNSDCVFFFFFCCSSFFFLKTSWPYLRFIHVEFMRVDCIWLETASCVCTLLQLVIIIPKRHHLGARKHRKLASLFSLSFLQYHVVNFVIAVAIVECSRVVSLSLKSRPTLIANGVVSITRVTRIVFW